METLKKISQAEVAKLHWLQVEVAEKESAEAGLEQKPTSFGGDKTHLKVPLQEKGVCFVNEAMCVEHTSNEDLCTVQMSWEQ